MEKMKKYPNELYVYLDNRTLSKIENRKLPLEKFSNGQRERVKVVLNNKNKKAELEIGVGFTSFMLSASLKENRSNESYIRINNIEGFIEAIKNELSRFGYIVTAIHVGKCIYNDRIVECTSGSSFDLEKELGIYGNNSNYNKMMSFINKCCEDDALFSLEKNKSSEEEYRIIWDTNKETTNNVLIDINKVLDFIEIYRKESVEA